MALSAGTPPVGLLVTATDPQHQALQVNTLNGLSFTPGQPITLPSGGTLTLQSSGAFTYTPASDFVGLDSFTFTALDQGGNVSSPGTVNIGVLATLSLRPEVLPATGSNGDTITEDLVLDNPNPAGFGPLEGFNVALTYDSAALSTATDQIGEGDLPASWTFLPNGNTPGVIGIGGVFSNQNDAIKSTSPLVLATITFTITANANQNTAIKIVPSARAGAATLNTVLAGVGGSYPINPAPQSMLFISGVDAEITVTGQSSGVSLEPSVLPTDDVGLPYTGVINAVGGNGGPFTYTITSGSVPAGLSTSLINDPQYLLSGTPTQAGVYTFTVTATDSGMPAQSGSLQYTITINPPVAISTSSPAGLDHQSARLQFADSDLGRDRQRHFRGVQRRAAQWSVPEQLPDCSAARPRWRAFSLSRSRRPTRWAAAPARTTR